MPTQIVHDWSSGKLEIYKIEAPDETPQNPPTDEVAAGENS